MPDLAFTKMHGLGNDFVVIQDLAEEWDLTEPAIELLCDRHFGVGADGVLIVRNATRPDADYRMLYFNADGTAAEMCGNGVRCFAKYLVDRDMVRGDSLAIETLGGVKRVEVVRDYDGTMATATVDMGEPVLDPGAIPTTLSSDDGRIVDAPLETACGTVRVTPVSMGNPHAVIWVDDVDEAPVETVGPVVETHAAFPRKTNVEFAQLAADDVIRLRVWERGCGETLACGTGACATVVAAVLGCRLAGRAATVELPGGELFVRWDEDGHVYLTGPATEVFTGMMLVPEEDES